MLSFHVTLAHHPRPSVSPRNPCSLRVSALDSSSFPSFAVIRHSPLTPLFLPFVFNRFRTLSFSFPVSSLLATLTITAGVYPNNSHSGTHHPGVTTTIFVLSFHALTNCPFSISFLLIFIHVMGGWRGTAVLHCPNLRPCQRVFELSPFFSGSCALFCTHRKLNPFVFKQFHTLCQKHSGWGHVQPARSSLRRTLGRKSLPRITGHESRGIRPPRITSLLYILTPLLLSFSHEGHF